MTKQYQKPRGKKLQINLELGIATGCFLVARWSEPNSIEDLQWGFVSFMAWLMCVGLIGSAIKKMRDLYRYETYMIEIDKGGNKVKTSGLASDDLMKSKGIVGDD